MTPEVTADVRALLKSRRFAEAEAMLRPWVAGHASDATRWLARALEGQGRRREAADLWRQVLADAPDDADALHRLGLLHARAGQSAIAARYFERLTEVAPDRADAWANLAVAARAIGQAATAVLAADAALARDPELPTALATRGALAFHAGDTPRAITALTAALAGAGHFDRTEAQLLLGRALRRAGDTAGAERALRAALPAPEAYVRLARLHLADRRLDAARDAAAEGRATHPDHPELARVAGVVAVRQGRTRDAIQAFRECLGIVPNDAGAWANLAAAAWSAGDLTEARAAAVQAIAIDATLGLAHHTLGRVLDATKDSAAIGHFERAIAVTPHDPYLRCDLAHALRRDSRLDDAMRQYDAILDRDPNFAPALSGAGTTSKDQGRAARAVGFLRRAHALRPTDQAIWDNLLLTMHYDPEVTAPEILAAHQEWGRDAEARPVVRPRARRPGPIRVGYVSGDLGQHPVGAFLLGVLPAHDLKAFRVHVYSTRTNPDDYTRRFQAAADRWVDAVRLSDAELLQAILDDDIDILVDLAGHTKGHRLAVFARQPAPVQVTWAGYVGTTGLTRVDWLIGDAVHTPRDDESVEQVWRMPTCYVPYTPPATAPPTLPAGDAPSRRRGYITFGCFNNVAKLSPPTIAVWRRILEAVPTARMLLQSHSFADPGVQAWYLAQFGPTASRVELRGRIGHKTLMRTYAEEVDIALDPFPYSGGLTTLEALWMSVPVITLGGGDRFCSRHSSGHLTAIGEGRTIARDADDYVRLAVALADDHDRRIAERGSRRERMAASPVLDSQQFTRDLEEAFRQMLARSPRG